jgi:hypothetical protein
MIIKPPNIPKKRLLTCVDFDEKRQFLVGHVERVIYNRYKVTILGSIPIQSAVGETKVQFRIKGEIDAVAVHRNGQRRRKEVGQSSPPVWGVICQQASRQFF